MKFIPVACLVFSSVALYYEKAILMKLTLFITLVWLGWLPAFLIRQAVFTESKVKINLRMTEILWDSLRKLSALRNTESAVILPRSEGNLDTQCWYLIDRNRIALDCEATEVRHFHIHQVESFLDKTVSFNKACITHSLNTVHFTYVLVSW